ncbi:protein Mis18-alpha-like isoform X2 [Orbicella faveolata]|uniref:protein Mis18-alpha-like isoform X2 n=1 Tax=Orbicella faveolata TaxID=48498 RepID=UPI0009E554FF|nr:protein Mis18-alpha-like isoform X2 [Orbicella faveolata]
MPLQCKSCKSAIGRIYRTTPRELDHLSYQVGSVNGMQTVTREEVLDLPTAKTLQQGIHKIESVIIMLLERLRTLEAGLEIRTNDEDTNGKLFASKAVNSGIDSQVAVIDKSHEKPSKKKRK